MRTHTEPVEILRHVYERIELRIWGWLPQRVRKRLTTYGLAEIGSYLPTGRGGEASLHDLVDAVARGQPRGLKRIRAGTGAGLQTRSRLVAGSLVAIPLVEPEDPGDE